MGHSSKAPEAIWQYRQPPPDPLSTATPGRRQGDQILAPPALLPTTEDPAAAAAGVGCGGGGAEAGGGGGNHSRRLVHLGLRALHRGQGSSLVAWRQPTTPWLVVLVMGGMAAAANLDPTQIRRQFFMWIIDGVMRAPVRGWRISAEKPTTTYVFMAKLRAVLISRKIGTTRLSVKTDPDCGLGGRWRRL